MELEEIVPIFGKVIADWSVPQTIQLEPFLFYVHGTRKNDRSALRLVVTDFQSNTFEAIKSRNQLEDMRDNIGIGGQWSDFVHYITDSIKSEDVKLVVEGSSKSGGASHAKLIAQKAKGLPRISISLAKLMDGAAGQAMANLSMELHKEFKNIHKSLVEEQEKSCRLTMVVAAEREKNDSIQKQLNMVMDPRNHKFQKIENPDSKSLGIPQNSPGKQTTQHQSSTKVSNRVVPAFRRAKVRGAVLVDTKDDDMEK